MISDLSVSVVIPCYNAASWVPTALASVAAQSVPAREVIVVDDGSTDGSDIAVQQTGFPVRQLHTPRLGAAGALNAALEAASGEWIAFLDADDLWYPNHLERAARFLAANGDSGMLNHVDLATLDGRIRERPYHWPIAEPAGGLSAEQFLCAYETAPSFVGMSACIVRRDSAVKIGGFDTRQTARLDIEFWLRLIARRTWTFDPVASSAYRSGVPGSLSQNYVRAQYYHLLALVRNKESYPFPAMGRLLARLARRALSAALTDGTPEDVTLAQSVAADWLSREDRLLFSAAMRHPAVFRALNRQRRRFLNARKTVCNRGGEQAWHGGARSG